MLWCGGSRCWAQLSGAYCSCRTVITRRPTLGIQSGAVEARSAGKSTRSISCRAVTWLCILDGWKLLSRATSSDSLRKMLMLICASHLRPAHSVRSAFSCLGIRNWEMPMLKRRKSPTEGEYCRDPGARSAGHCLPRSPLLEKLRREAALTAWIGVRKS